MDPLFSAIRKNKWGDYCYKEVQTPEPLSINADQLCEHVVWTIENPSPACIEYFPSATLRNYDGVPFLFSKKAAECIPKEQANNGEVTVVETKINEMSYYIMVGDNKHYMMNSGGGCEEEENKLKGKCAVRELKEEMNILTTPQELEEIAQWEFTERNELCGEHYKRKSTTNAFYLFVQKDKILHLIPKRGLDSTNITSVDVKTELDVNLNEITHIYFIPKLYLESLPTKIGNRSFDGHHRELLKRLSKIGTPVNSFSYLHSFKYYKQ